MCQGRREIARVSEGYEVAYVIGNEGIQEQGIPFNFNIDYSHVVFKIGNAYEQDISGVREEVRAGRSIPSNSRRIAWMPISATGCSITVRAGPASSVRARCRSRQVRGGAGARGSRPRPPARRSSG